MKDRKKRVIVRREGRGGRGKEEQRREGGSRGVWGREEDIGVGKEDGKGENNMVR
jgi:hypothetical protein